MKKNDHYPLHLYNNVKAFRKSRHWSQTALAEKIHVTRNTLIRIENNESLPSVLIALQLAKCLETTVEELFSFKKIKILTEEEKFDLEIRQKLINQGLFAEEDFS